MPVAECKRSGRWLSDSIAEYDRRDLQIDLFTGAESELPAGDALEPEPEPEAWASTGITGPLRFEPGPGRFGLLPIWQQLYRPVLTSFTEPQGSDGDRLDRILLPPTSASLLEQRFSADERNDWHAGTGSAPLGIQPSATWHIPKMILSDKCSCQLLKVTNFGADERWFNEPEEVVSLQDHDKKTVGFAERPQVVGGHE